MKSTTPAGVTFVIPCFNSGSYLYEAVRSVVSQPSLRPFEALVVDDGSDDSVTAEALTACARLPNVRILRHRHCGAAATRNAGIRSAVHPYIMPLDSDDRLAVDPDLLADGTYSDRAATILDSEPEVAFVHTMSCMFGAFQGLTISSYPARDDLVVQKHHVPTSIVCRRGDALAAGLYDPAVVKWQDWAFAVNILGTRFHRGAGTDIACVPGPFHQYRVHDNWGRLSSAEVSEYNMTRLVVEKNLDLFQAHFTSQADVDSLTREVLAHKPSRLEDLLHMANFDLPQALQVAKERQFSTPSPFAHLGIP